MGMKKLLFLIPFISFVFFANGQGQEGYFSIKDNFIVWTKIYDTIPDLEAMKKNPILEFASETSGSIKKSNPIPLTKRKLDEITGSFRIDQKDGRYKVEVSNIRITPSYTISLYGISSTDSDYSLEEAGLNKKFEFNDNFLNHLAKPYDNLFSSYFDPKEKKDDW